ncbi:MAG: membrane protein insertion efficiency factor YidD [Coriobacteriaceae bacterium]|nr:membrane protein insertion efficiency factor YidD [Coriobacteriaceae bacterium]
MGADERKPGIVARAMMACIRFYQRFISPLLPATCIYTPTCSEYAMQAVRKYGCLRGGYLAIKRILRCHPFHEGGYDPVP